MLVVVVLNVEVSVRIGLIFVVMAVFTVVGFDAAKDVEQINVVEVVVVPIGVLCPKTRTLSPESKPRKGK